jgi:hypothetical protein
MNQSTKKNDDEKQRPKFKAHTLGVNELCQVKGGVAPETGATHGCHVDGVCDPC